MTTRLSVANDAVTRIGPRLREFEGGYEARIVDEPRAGRQHWILRYPDHWGAARTETGIVIRLKSSKMAVTKKKKR